MNPGPACASGWCRLAGSVLLAVLSVTGLRFSAAAFQDDPECARWRRAFLAMPTRALNVETVERHRVRLVAKVAATDDARWAGFQCASTGEIRATVLLFDFGREIVGAFHMRNVPAPLDIAFAKESGRVFSILRMEPSPTATYAPMSSYRYAIEARAGFFKEVGIAPGAVIVGRDPGSRTEDASDDRQGNDPPLAVVGPSKAGHPVLYLATTEGLLGMEIGDDWQPARGLPRPAVDGAFFGTFDGE